MYTKYVYGNGLISEQSCDKSACEFKVYHFDYRGSTVAITNYWGNVTDRFKYDTYGKVTQHIGYNKDIIFTYNGRDGVITEPNGLYYMRARYYSPDLMRFIHADIVSGSISNAITLNRYAYANGNPVSNIDPFGLSAWNEFWRETLGKMKNTDGTSSFYDNRRTSWFHKDNPFHEQIIVWDSNEDLEFSLV